MYDYSKLTIDPDGTFYDDGTVTYYSKIKKCWFNKVSTILKEDISNFSPKTKVKFETHFQQFGWTKDNINYFKG